MSTTPQLLDKYELRERVAQSDRAELWRAFDPQQQRDVAIKILHTNIQADPDFPTRFIREAERIASLHHPNIVQVRDFRIARSPESDAGEKDLQGTPQAGAIHRAPTIAYIVMDYVEGQTLADYIDSTSHQGKFPPASEIVRLLIPIGLALDYAHQRGIIHGDLKPANILLDKSNTSVNPMGQPILTDFGIAQMLRAPNRSFSGSSPDTSFYTSPEQAQGFPDNERSDLYSLGVILYEMFTGILPFQGDNPNDTLMRHIRDTPTSPALINPNILPALTAAILRSLAKDPAARFPSAVAMVATLAKAINMPVPENLTQAANTVDTMNMLTYLSPLPSSRPLGMTPSSPSLPGIGASLPASFVATSTSPVPSAGQTQGASPQVTNVPTQAFMQSPAAPSSDPRLTPALPPRKQGRRGLYIAFIALLIVVLIGSGLAYFAFLRNTSVTTKPITGHAFFVSSGLLSVNSTQGITDELQINLRNIPNPQPGKSYYAWLLNDKKATDQAPILLGSLQVNQGSVNFAFPGTSQHVDLLAIYSRFLITEEDANVTPTNPSLDPSTFRYYAEFPTMANLTTHFSVLDHLRHLLAEDPKLKLVGLTGGLDIWLFRNTEKLVEWSGSAKDAWQGKSLSSSGYIHRQVVRILDYLDGRTYVSHDVPPGTPLLVDQTIARVALLEFDLQNQVPPGYLFHIGKHLREITETPNVTSAQVTLAIEINKAINNVKFWLERVHKDAVQLVNMTDAQLLQPSALSILDDMATSANSAFAGQIDPSTNQVAPGVVQVHYNIQRLATFDITPCTSNTCAL